MSVLGEFVYRQPTSRLIGIGIERHGHCFTTMLLLLGGIAYISLVSLLLFIFSAFSGAVVGGLRMCKLTAAASTSA